MENVISNNVNIDIESIATELVIGPQEKLMKKLRDLNNNYITRTYMYGNRSALEPLEPLGITRTYRWKPGYKNVILETINTRFHQYNKNSSNLQTLLINRPDRMHWNKKNFIKEIIDIDETLKDLRKRKITTDSTVDTAIEKFNVVISLFQDRVKYAEEFLEAFDDIDIHSYIRYADMENEDNVYNEMMKWKTATINVEIRFNNPHVTIYGPDRDNNNQILGKVFTEPIYLHFEMPVSHLVNALFSKDIEDVTHNDLTPSNRYESATTRQRNDGLRRFSQGVKVIGKWLGKKPDDSTNRRVYEHPFMSSTQTLDVDLLGSTYWEKWEEESDGATQYQNSICFGNLQDEVMNSFAKLNIIGLIQILQSWLTYRCGVTGPLNPISLSILYLDQDYHEDLPLAIGLSTNNLYSRILQMFGMDVLVAENPISIYRTDSYGESYAQEWHYRSDWYHHYNKDAAISDTSYGWDFTVDNWLPLKSQIREVCDAHHYGKVFEGLTGDDELPFEEPNYDNINDAYKEIQDIYICKVQESIIDEIIATVEWFYDNNCQSMDSIEFAYMVDFLYRVGYFDQEVPLLLEETNRVQNMIRMTAQSLPSTTQDLELESEDQTNIIEEVVLVEEEPQEEPSYEEQMNSYNWERRMNNVVQD